MSDIDAPSNIPLQAGEAANRVTRASTTSDDSSAQQQSTDRKSKGPETVPEIKERPASHDTAVTLSAHLANLEAGSRISASYLGVDGENQPLISSETGSYIIRHDPSVQPEIDKIPRDATLDIKIIKVERHIEARLTYPAATDQKPIISIPVTLELTGLGINPPQVRPQTSQGRYGLDHQQIPYQTTDLYRAENIARESSAKLKELPLPTSTPNYTLYEKAIPGADRPAIIQSVIAGNVHVAQEQKTDRTASATLTNPITPAADIEKLLHRDTQATIVKNIPQVAVTLPDIVVKNLGATGPLDKLKAGENFILHIESIAVPGNLVTAPATAKPQQNVAAPVAGEISGIVIAPDAHILTDKNMNIVAKNPYPENYNITPENKISQDSKPQTLYVATPASVIKIQSPLALNPGTVINFTLHSEPQIKTDKNISATTARPAPETSTTGWVETTAVTNPGILAPLTTAPAPQPLENLSNNWQSLSQLLSVSTMIDSSSGAINLNNRIPLAQNPAQMTSAMMFFLAALGAKNPAQVWLGPQISQQMEKAGQGKLLQMLDSDMQRIFRLGAETPAGEWRPVLLPLAVGGDAIALPVLIRHITDEKSGTDDEKSEDEDDKTTATRFIVDLELSQLGQIQVDGLIKESKLNIIIRSNIILPSQMKQKMRDMFTMALEISGYSGDLHYKDNILSDLSPRSLINQKIHMLKV